MIPNSYIRNIKEYPLTSHKAWEYGDKASILKLDWNEADMPLADPITEAVQHFVAREPMSWYPDVANKELISVIASHVGLLDEQVQYFEGSDCGLEYAVRTFMEAGDEAILAAPTYDNFRVYVESVGGKAVPVFGRDLFSADPESLKEAITDRTKVIYIVNPNNPTGSMYESADIEALLATYPGVLLILDEAYAEFAGISYAHLVQRYANIIISRSFSKAFGLASFRIGYLLSSAENIGHLNKIRNGKNISSLSQIAALAALRNPQYMERYVQEVRSARTLLCESLRQRGVVVRETIANFILISVEHPDRVRQLLMEQKVFVRGLRHLPGMEQYLRITVGGMETTKRFIEIFNSVLDHA